MVVICGGEGKTLLKPVIVLCWRAQPDHEKELRIAEFFFSQAAFQEVKPYYRLVSANPQSTSSGKLRGRNKKQRFANLCFLFRGRVGRADDVKTALMTQIYAEDSCIARTFDKKAKSKVRRCKRVAKGICIPLAGSLRGGASQCPQQRNEDARKPLRGKKTVVPRGQSSFLWMGGRAAASVDPQKQMNRCFAAVIMHLTKAYDGVSQPSRSVFLWIKYLQ